MNLMKTVATVGGWTLAYRISSVIRDVTQAATLGAGPFADAFSVAFKLANILRKMFAEGAFNASFLPIFSSTLKSRGQEEASKVASQIFTCLVIIVTAITLFCIIYFKGIIHGYAPGFAEGSERFNHAVSLGRICFPFIATSFIAALFGGILNTVNRYAMPAAAQLVLNICVVIAMAIGALAFPNVAYTMAWGTFTAGVVQVAILWWNVHYLGFRVGFISKLFSPEVKAFFKKLISGALGAGVWQVNVIIDFIVATLLPTGCVSYIYYTEHLNAFPSGILGIAFSTALLPPLTRAVHAGNYDDAKGQLNLGLLFALILTMPAVVVLCTMHEPITAMIYGRGNFGPQQVAAASPALAAFAFGLPAYMITKVFTSAFFAHKNTRVPLIGGIISIVTNALFICFLLPIMKHNGIALATSLSSWLNAIYLLWALKKLGTINIVLKTWGQFLMQCVVSVAMLASISLMTPFAAPYYANGGYERNIAVIVVICASTFVFYVVGKCFGIFKFMKDLKTVAKD